MKNDVHLYHFHALTRDQSGLILKHLGVMLRKENAGLSKGAKPMLTLIIYGYIEMNVKLGLVPVVLSTEIMSKSHLFLLSDVMHVHAFQWSLYWFKQCKNFKIRQVKTIMVHFFGRFIEYRAKSALNIF